MRYAPSSLELLECGVALVLLGLLPIAMIRAYLRAHVVFAGSRDRVIVLIAVAVAALLRWVVAPHWMATIFMGYMHTRHAIDLLPLSRYGAGASAFYHALFAFLPFDHRWLMWANAVLGVITIPLSAAVVARLLGRLRAGAIFALLVALVPLFVRNDGSEANNVPCLFWMMGGLVLWEEHLDDGNRVALAASVPLFALAAIGRPEMPILVPLVIALYAWGKRAPRDRWRTPAALFAAVTLGVAMIPQVIHVAYVLSQPRQRVGLPGLGAFDAASRIFSSEWNVIFFPRLFPAALSLLAAASLALSWKGDRRPRVALAAIAFVALAAYVVDVDYANIARVHVPGALFITALAADAIATLWDRVRPRIHRAALIAAVVATGAPTARVIFAPTNEQAEEDFLRAVIPTLPPGPLTLVRVGGGDHRSNPPDHFEAHKYFPDYLVTPPVREGRTASVAEWLPSADLSGPVFFYWGMRCYARFRPVGTPRPPGEDLHPACARMRDEFTLTPVVERVVPNRGDVWIPYYGTSPTLRLGLYRVAARAR